MKKLIGETGESVVVLEFRKNRYFSVCGTEYGGTQYLFTEEQGEERARDYLEDGELWRVCVDAEQTTQGLSEWVEDVLNMDGWMETLGDIEEIQTKEGEWFYTQHQSGGQIDMHLKPSDFVKAFIPMSDIETIFKYWSEYHLKDLTEVPTEVIAKMERIFTPETTLNDWYPEVQS